MFYSLPGIKLQKDIKYNLLSNYIKIGKQNGDNGPIKTFVNKCSFATICHYPTNIFPIKIKGTECLTH